MTDTIVEAGSSAVAPAPIGALIEALAAHGVGTMFAGPGVPGEGLRVVTTHDECGAAHAAQAYAHLSGRAGVVVARGGPGLATIAPAVAAAAAAGLPVLVVSIEPADGPAAPDALALHSTRAMTAAEAADAVADAFTILRGPRPGPVHVSVPAEVATGAWPAVTRPVVPAPALAGSTVVEAMAQRLADAERPLLVVGSGAADAGTAITALAEEIGAPIATTVAGKGTLDEGHPLAVGASAALEAMRAEAAASDAVLAVGDVGPGLPGPVLESVAVSADPATALGALFAALPVRHARMGVARAAGLRAACRTETREIGGRFEELADAVREALPPEAVLVGDASAVTLHGTVPFFPVAGPHRFCSPAFAGPGYALPAAIGAIVARPGTPVAVVVGARDFLSGAAELGAAVALRRPLPIVVVDPDGSSAQHDLAMLALACGAHGVRAISPAAVADLVEDAWEADRPTVIHLDWVD